MKKSACVFAVLAIVAPVSIWAAPQLTVGSVPAASGGSFELPILFTEDARHPVSTLQFDFVLPSGYSSAGVITAQAASSASKNASSAVIKDRLRVIVFGINQNNIPSGELVKIKVQTKSDSPKSQPAFKLTGILFSDAKGNSIPAK